MRTYRFGSFVLDVSERRLLCDGQPVPLTPKVFDTLVHLVERDGRLVGKNELLEAVWGDAYVEEGSLPRAIHILRKTLSAADQGPERQYIETVPTKGYRFVHDVARLGGPVPPAADVAPSAIGGSAQAPDARLRRGAAYALAALLGVAVTSVMWRPVESEHTRPSQAASRLSSPTISGAAYARFQSGRLHLERRLGGDDEAAIDDFEAALRLDPTFAAAYAGKADANFLRYWNTGHPDHIVEARLAIRNALELDGENSYAYTMRCRLEATYDWDFAPAESSCLRAITLDPSNHEARRELAFLLNALGRQDEALQAAAAAVALAPTSFNKRAHGVLLYFSRRFDEAIAQLKEVEAGDPEFVESSRWIARAFEQTGRYAQALEFLVRFRTAAGAPPEQIASLRRAFASGSWSDVLSASLPKDPGAANLDTAGTLAQLGRLDAALDVLEAMIARRRVMIVHMTREPRLDPLRSEQRFRQLAARVGLP